MAITRHKWRGINWKNPSCSDEFTYQGYCSTTTTPGQWGYMAPWKSCVTSQKQYDAMGVRSLAWLGNNTAILLISGYNLINLLLRDPIIKAKLIFLFLFLTFSVTVIMLPFKITGVLILHAIPHGHGPYRVYYSIQPHAHLARPSPV